MVHASQGNLEPASEHLQSEPWIVAAIAKATLPKTLVNWDELVADYDRIREKIEIVYPMFASYNEQIRKPGGFRLYIAASERKWATPDGKAHFKWADKDVTLGSDSHSLYSNGGTALVVHAKADDQKTDPAGNAGDRIACGSITK